MAKAEAQQFRNRLRLSDTPPFARIVDVPYPNAPGATPHSATPNKRRAFMIVIRSALRGHTA
ncbi:hypothetical protein ACJMQP_25300 (plasmid) [Rhodopseudomonas palustris]